MQRRILDFTNILRRAGIRVSTAEALDAFVQRVGESESALLVLVADSPDADSAALGKALGQTSKTLGQVTAFSPMAKKTP